jgi:DNA-binding CsgD family transcriptional regulator
VSVDSVQRGVVRAARGASTLEELVRGVHDVYASAFAVDLWCALAFDPATVAPTGGYHDEGLPLARMPRLVEIEAGVDDVATFAALASAAEPVATLDRVTEGCREVSVRYQDVLAPSGVGPELRVVFRDGGATWGGMVLMRGTDLGDFRDDELAAVSSSVRDVAGALRRLLVQHAATSLDTTDGPGLLLLDGDGLELREQTSAAARWLAEFEDGTTDDEVPYAVVALAATARATGGAHRARLRTRSGRWLTLHAERLGDAASPVSIILQPSSPDEIARILAAAHGLTARELEVAELVARGLGNREIAETLFVSRYTVQDHLKHVFEKLGVGSRAELTSRLYLSWDGNAAASIGR